MSRLTLKNAKVEALELLQALWPCIETTFRDMAIKQLAWRGEVHVDRTGAEKRLLDAVFVAEEDREVDEDGELSYYGMTDGDMIWIDRDIEYKQMIGTLIHEALHDCVFLVRPTRAVERRGLSCEFEHSVMERLPVWGI